MSGDDTQKEAADRVRAELAKRVVRWEEAESEEEIFDPWALFPCVYGSYSSEFDGLALDVLTDLANGRVRRRDLAAEMFREMLCVADLCVYGSSPRVCFATTPFRAVLPDLIAKWREYARLKWSAE